MKIIRAAPVYLWLIFVPSIRTNYFSVMGLGVMQNLACFEINVTSVANNYFSTMAETNEKISLDTRLNLIRSKPVKVEILIASCGTESVAGGTLELTNGTIVYLHDSSVQVLWDLRDALDLTLEIVLSKNWDEAWELVESGEVELGSTLLTVTLKFGQHSFASVTKLLPLVSTPSMVYFRQPSSSSKERRYSIFEPLEISTWKSLMACWMLCVVVCHLIHRLPIWGETSSKSIKSFSFSETLLWIATISSGKDYPANSRDPGSYQTSLRIAMMSAIVLSVIITAIYTAKIVVYFSRETRAVKSPDDLLRLGYEIGTWSYIHIDRLFQGLHFDETRKATALNDVLNSSSLAIMKKLLGIQPQNILYAYLTHPDGYFDLHDPEVQKYRDGLCEVSSFSSSVKSARAMVLNKKSPHKEVLNWKILQLVERGINFRHQRNHLKLFEHSCSDLNDPLEKLSLQHTFFIFSMVVFGAIVSVVVVVCEHIHHRVHIYKNKFAFSYCI